VVVGIAWRSFARSEVKKVRPELNAVHRAVPPQVLS
jgi:hypothetical protein